MSIILPEQYWNRNPSGLEQLTTHYERIRYTSALDWANKVVATNGSTIEPKLNVKDFFQLKQELANGISSEDDTGYDIARFSGDEDSQEEQRVQFGILTPQENNIVKSVNNEASKKILQMYTDAYMAPIKSDIEWRLGNVTGLLINNDGSINDDYNLLDNQGRLYTRSNFSLANPVQYWNGATRSIETISDSGGNKGGLYFTNLLFPPYKMGDTHDISRINSLPEGWEYKYYKYEDIGNDGIKKVTQTDIPLFDPIDFKIKRDGFNYREPAFKAINDNIMFLQYLVERSCGIVSTYLTEWDLSVYMQEGIITTYEKLPSKVWLLYRIDKDNPLAYLDNNPDYTRNYDFTGIKSYAFGVINAAVSKLFDSNQRPWRPSDYPLSAFWAPYLKGIHMNLINYTTYDAEDQTVPIPYYDFYDTAANEQYNFNQKIENGNVTIRPTKEKIQQQDFIQAVQAGWVDFDLQYYQALYATPDDGIGAADKNFQLAKQERWPLSKLVDLQKDDMLSTGGANGASKPAGYISKIIAKIVKPGKGGRGDGGNSKSADEELKQAKSEAGDPLSDFLMPEQEQEGPKLKGKVANPSKMGKDTGLAYSPCLYGGPHGSFYSPHNTESFFEKDSLFLRDIPRLNPITDWSSLNDGEYKQGNDSWYYNNLPGDHSPNESMHNIMQGIQNYTIAYALTSRRITRVFDGIMSYMNGWGSCVQIELPSHWDGQYISYAYKEIVLNTGTGKNSSTTTYRQPIIWYTTEYMTTNRVYYSNSRRGQWTNYYNDFVYSRYLGGGYWSVGYRCPHSIGTYTKYEYVAYKKLLLHDEPEIDWQIRPYQWADYSSPVETWRTALGRACASFGGFRWSWGYKEEFKYDVGFRLICPGNSQQGSENPFRLDIFDDIYGWTSYSLSGNETKVLHKMVRVAGRPNASVELIFCQGPYYDIPHALFSARVFTYLFPMWYWQRHTRTYSSRRRRTWYTLELKWATSLMVDLFETPKLFASGLNETPYSNMNVGRYNSLTSSFEPNHLFSFPGKVGGSGTVSAKRRTLNDPLELMANTSYLQREPSLINEIRSQYVSYGYSSFIQSLPNGFFTWLSSGCISGRGIISSIQGCNPNTDMMISEFEDNSRWTKMGNWNNKSTFNNLSYVCHQGIQISTPPQIDMGGYKWYPETSGGIISWRETTMPSRIQQAIKSMLFGATFYKSDITDENNLNIGELEDTLRAKGITDYSKVLEAKKGHPYLVYLDVPFRVFLSQLLYQKSYMDLSKKLLVDDVSFVNLRTLLNSCVDKVTLYTTDQNTSGYSYWIQKAVELFGNTDNTQLEAKKQELINQVDKTITLYNNTIDILKRIVSVDIRYWSYSDWVDANTAILSIHAQNEANTDLSDYYMAYLNILYEYRKFFICKRFNKEDGTMWAMRALESILPWACDTIDATDMPKTLAQMGQPGSGNGAQYNIAFYELQNTLDIKKAALQGLPSITTQLQDGTYQDTKIVVPLPEDAIKVVYIKVKYVKQEDYAKWIAYSTQQSNEKVAEVIEVYKPIKQKQTIIDSKGNKMTVDQVIGSEKKYAIKPEDNDYTIISNEWEINEKNRKWDEVHAEDIESGKRLPRTLSEKNRIWNQEHKDSILKGTTQAKSEIDIDTVTWPIIWGDDPSRTPIVFDLFSNIDIMRMIEYAKGSVSTQELLCFSKEDSDFWKVPVMGTSEYYNNKPRKAGHKTKLRLKHIGDSGNIKGFMSIEDDITYTVAGAMGYSLWPITEKQENPTMSDVSLLLENKFKTLTGLTDRGE